MAGICYIVGTPIGNLKDITLRALDTLKAVDVIASEDTRKSLILLNAYGIKKPLISYYKHKEREGAEQIIAILDGEKSVALITDAGMPSISDPGAILIAALRERGYKVEAVPGATAVTTAVSLCGLDKDGFAFIGFLPPKKKDRDAIINNLKDIMLPLVLYCAPHDLDQTLEYLYTALGERRVWAAKELTKLYETVYEGRLGNIDIDNKKGEFVLIIDAADAPKQDDRNINNLIKAYVQQGLSRSQAAKRVAEDTGLPKNTVYQASLSLDEDAE